MTQWTQEALLAEAQKQLNAKHCERYGHNVSYEPDWPATLLVAELIGRCEQLPVDPFRALWKDAIGESEAEPYFRSMEDSIAAPALLRERFEAMLTERMGK